MPPLDRAAVFVEHHVAQPVQTVFDAAPMIANPLGQLRGVRPPTRQGRDVVRRLGGRLTVLRSLTHNPADLLDPRPIEMLIEGHRADQRAAFEAAVALVGFRERLPFGFTLPLCPGGKRPPVGR